MFEFFEHTADLGIRARAAELADLLDEAARALTAAIAAHPEHVREVERWPLRIEGDEPELLLFDWLNEILYLFESRALLGCRFEVTVDETGASGVMIGESFDETRHGRGHEVKAITYHALRVERVDEGWLAEVIVDI